MAVSMELVKELRERTGIGMMECKKALDEAQGDIEVAIEELRKKGLAKAAKKSDREAFEGGIKILSENGKSYVISKDGKPGPICTKLYNKLRGIQYGDEPDTHGWVTIVE